MKPNLNHQLIPRSVIFGNPDKVNVNINADATQLGYLAPLDGVMNIWICPLDDLESARPVTDDQGRGITGFLWSHIPDQLLYIQDRDGDENWRVYSLNTCSGKIINLTPESSVHAQIRAMSRRFPREIVVGLNDRMPEYHDLYRVDITTGEKKLLIRNDGYMGYLLDRSFRVRMGYRITKEGSAQVEKFTSDGSREPFMEISYEDSITTHWLHIDDSDQLLYLMDSRNRDTAALVSIDLVTGEYTLLAENSQADLTNKITDTRTGTVRAVMFEYDIGEWVALDPEFKQEMTRLQTFSSGRFSHISNSSDDMHWIISYSPDDEPRKYYYYNRSTHEIRYLFSHRTKLENLNLAPMRPVVIPARDGLNLVSYYTVPADIETNESGIPCTPLPTVINVHGGPNARDFWGLHPEHQWLANRGYAVLSVNFRGSTGFGKSFVNAGDRQWGLTMHDDLIDAVNWMVENGISDPDKIAIYGGSYGGYAVLAGLTFTPDIFCAGVDLFGPSNIESLLNAMPAYWKPAFEMAKRRVGDPTTAAGCDDLRKRSPLTYVQNISKPLMILQGANDPRVKPEESDQIVEAMKSNDLPVLYLFYSNEGHGLARPGNRISSYAITEAFLAKHLGGKVEPIGDDLDGASLTVREGAEMIGGLPEILASRK